MRLLLALLVVAALPAPALAVPFVVDTTNHVIETSQIKLQFALDCPERVMNAWYKPYSTSARVNGESLPWEFTGQMIQAMWAGQGPIFSQGTDATDHSWNVISQTATQLVLRIESHSTYPGQLNPRVRTDYTFFADSSSYQVERTGYFSGQNWPLQTLQPYVFRASATLVNTLRWRNALGVLQSGGFCNTGCFSADWDRKWSYINGPALSVAVMNHPSNLPALNLMNDTDASSFTCWTGPLTPLQTWTSDVTWRALVHFSTTPANFALEDAVYAWWTQLPVSGVEPSVSGEALRLAIAPNPAAASATVAFSLPTAGPADVGVFDLSGRRVATLVQGAQLAGEHTARWNGNAADGTRAAPGLYLVRVRAGAAEAVRRLAWLR